VSEPRDDDTRVSIRRAPKYSAFMIVGGGLGALITFIVTRLFPVDPLVGFWALFAYFALFGITAGVLVGGLLALLLDWRSRKRAGTAIVEHTEESD
jgi:MFS family permease